VVKAEHLIWVGQMLAGKSRAFNLGWADVSRSKQSIFSGLGRCYQVKA